LSVAEAIGPTLEGNTERQKNPHPPHSLAWLAWIIARLGGWNCCLCSSPHYSELRGIIRWRSKRPQKTI
jgi:hypothetical protein